MKFLSRLFLPLLLMLFASGITYAQVKTYDAEWKKVDDLVQNKNLPRTALEQVKKIYLKAKKEKQQAQIIKSLVYMISLQQNNRENNQIVAIQEITKEIASSTEPATSILKSFLAGLYWQYFQTHRWQLYDRTNTASLPADIATWSIEDFHKKIGDLFLQSIAHDQILKQTKLTSYEAIIDKGTVRPLRPTMYDLLAHKALEYFKNSERDIQKPVYAFEISQPEAFAPAAAFSKYTFQTKDSASLQYKALQIYQQLIAFHLQKNNLDALIDVDIDRIEFVYSHSVNENKDSLYVNALQQLIAVYPNAAATNQAAYLLAAFYNQQAAQYNPLQDSTHRFDRVKAKEILQRIVHDSSIKNEGWANSFNLLQQINSKSFSFEVEKVNVPAQPFRGLVKYKNISNLHFRLIAAGEALKKQMQVYDGREKYWSSLLNAASVKSWTQNLPVNNDLQEHSVEVKIDALPSGEYFLLASSDEKFSSNSVLAAQLLYVSNISYVNSGNDYFVLHRQTGEPLPNADVDVFKQTYDYKTSKYVKTNVGAYKTNKNGYFSITKDSVNRSYGYLLDVTYGEDTLSLNDQTYHYYNYNNGEDDEDTVRKIFFFTDRSIYRPGQTVYFKGIVVRSQNEDSKAEPNYAAELFLEDANGEDIDSLELTTNEFGSFSGRFQLPQHALNGSFRIYDADDENSTSFSVEEYKRPNFQVSFDTLSWRYKVNDTIAVTGIVKAYAGNLLSNAKVVYRVVRQPRFIYPWLVRKTWFSPTAPMEMAHGETETDAQGQFEIKFVAVPDKKIEPGLNPVFDYKIYADVTDITGETRSAENTISAGYSSLILKLNLPARLPVDSMNKIFVRTENMSGQYQLSHVTISAVQLIPEQRLIRNRFWQQPDEYIMSKQEYISYFPHDEYKNEIDISTWPEGDTIFKRSDSTVATGKFSVDAFKWAQGFYKIIATTLDEDGKEIKNVAHVELFDARSNQLNKPEYLWSMFVETPVEPRETASVQIGTAADKVHLISEVEKQKQENEFSFTKLKDEKKAFTYKISEADRGGFGVNYFFVKDNRFFQVSDIINVPWSNKELQIEYATFRDKTLPGREETWKVKIKGNKNERVAAEMLASMYDASLDQFKPHNWQTPSIWPTFGRLFSWNGTQNFNAVQSEVKWDETRQVNFEKVYDHFIFRTKGRREIVLRGARTMAPESSDFSEVLEGKAAGVVVQNSKVADSAASFSEVVVTAIEKKEELKQAAIQPRKNFSETAFFFPDLRTDENGTIEFSFTMPEALTKWKLQTLAHTKELAFGLSQKELVTQKELMVQPNAPRFLRQGDHFEFAAKIVNLSEKEITGQVQLELFNTATNESVDGWFMNTFPNQYFTVAAGQSEAVKFPIQVPFQFNTALTWRITARAGNLSDAEENILPVLTNKVLITESVALPMSGTGTKAFQFDRLLQSGQSETLQHQSLTVEYTSNPAWYAVQALPYLAIAKNESVDQIWSRYYANALATHIVSATPRLKAVFEQWKTSDTAALLSNLEKNQELKSVLLAETPWVLQAKTESEQKRNIALLFEVSNMSAELKSTAEKLRQMQSPNGGFVWFTGGPDDRYMTQNILTGIGHLKNIGVQVLDLNDVTKAALNYLDHKIKEDYEKLLKSKADLTKQQIAQTQIQYLYMRSFFGQEKVPATSNAAYAYYKKQAKQFWNKQDILLQGMIALLLHRTGDVQTPSAILKSLKETSIYNQELGRYWKENRFGFSWRWWHAPIETQSLMVEVFSEIANDTKTVNELRTWLIKNKQTNNWRTSKATADAVYAMLLNGADWLTQETTVQIQLGNMVVTNRTEQSEAGTGYIKKTIEGSVVKPEMGKINVIVKTGSGSDNAPSWGAVYWQYFEDMDKVTYAATPLQLTKKLYVEKGTDRGPVLEEVEPGTSLHTGDKIKVRIELRVDRDMDYVHMKDMRASALEPTNVLSTYKWQGGLGYYESTKDASTEFFFNHLNKGTYVFEYPLFVSQTGSFSNGITTIQCLYAPEFAAHSEGVQINVE